MARRCARGDPGGHACARDANRGTNIACCNGGKPRGGPVRNFALGNQSAVNDALKLFSCRGGRNGPLIVWTSDPCIYFPDLVLEFTLCDQGMGAWRRAAPWTHAAGRKRRGVAHRVLADRNALSDLVAD